MKFFDRFRKSEIKFGELEKSHIANEKWIEHYFKITLNRPKDHSHEQFIDYLENLKNKIFEFSLGEMIDSDSLKHRETLIYKGTLNKNLTIISFPENDAQYSILIRFIDKKEEDNKNTGQPCLIRNKDPNDNRGYKFSPIESLISIKTLQNIEFDLVAVFKFKQEKQMTYLGFDDEDQPYVMEFDGIQYLKYPFEKRVELHKDHPELDKKLFGNELNEFIKWIVSKKDVSEHDKKYCVKIEEIIKKY